MPHKVSVIIPAYNEGMRISDVLAKLSYYDYEVLVIDDGSTDDTIEVARRFGVNVVCQRNSGYINAVKTGFAHATGDIFVTIDADGEHNPSDIPRIIKPILENKADVVLGKRNHIPRPSERFLNFITNLRIPLHDTGTGFRAMKRTLALKLNIPGKCICGASVLEYYYLGARVAEAPISIKSVHKPRKIAWGHCLQFLYVIRLLFKKSDSVRSG